MKNYFNSSIQYYLRHLSENGCPDPVREVTTDFTTYMKKHLSEEQKNYINKNTITKPTDKKILEDILIIIKTMRMDKKYDDNSLKLIEEGLKSLL